MRFDRDGGLSHSFLLPHQLKLGLGVVQGVSQIHSFFSLGLCS
ncbi:hypothetical protein CGMCC3_g12196 [Colletotrichum fructicola]|nr:uncharacterized protein CGMCC3_g12196 [Colletotrichum fructicola]KAE9571667.1 hypothetical protein CGMCC3_g12196 [Colletotrichum fructicola]